jgi:branched-chain amino acid transport system ATP-binding protein
MLLELNDVSAAYGRLQALWGVSLQVAKGEIVLLVGANGSGKSTTMRTVVGVTRLVSGEVHYTGEDVSKVAYSRRLRKGLGYIPEGRCLFGDLSVRDNLVMSARQVRRRDVAHGLDEVVDLFPVLSDRMDQRVQTLSGGQQQMVAIGRALIRQPNLMLLDEPSIGLAPSVLHEFNATIRSLAARGVAVMIAEQNTEWLKGLPGRAYMLQGGRVVEEGDVSILESDEIVRRVFLGG